MILFKLLALPVTAPMNGILAVMRVIQAESDKEHSDPEVLRAQLAKLQTMVDEGEIDEDTYEMIENDILDRLDALDMRGQSDE